MTTPAAVTPKGGGLGVPWPSSIPSGVAIVNGSRVAIAPPPIGGGASDTASLQAWLNSIPSGVTEGIIPSGTYTLTPAGVSGGQDIFLVIPRSNLWIRGAGKGATVINATSPVNGGRLFVVSGLALTSLGVADPLNPANWITSATVYTFTAPVAQYANSATLAPADAANFAAGDYVFLRTGQVVQNITNPTRDPDCEIIQVASVNAGTGVVSFVQPTSKPYVQEYSGVNPGTGPSIPTPGGTAFAFGMSSMRGQCMTDVTLSDMTLSITSPSGQSTILFPFQASGVELRDCEVTSYDYSVCGTRFAAYVSIRRNTCTRNPASSNTNPTTVAPSQGCTHWDVTNNKWRGLNGRFHTIGGVADYKIRNNDVQMLDCTIGTNLASNFEVGNRAYDVIFEDNTIVGNTSNTPVSQSSSIEIDALCTQGGCVIQRNSIKNAGVNYTLLNSGSGWTIRHNTFPPAAIFNDSGLNSYQSNTPNNCDANARITAVKTGNQGYTTLVLTNDTQLVVNLPAAPTTLGSKTWRIFGLLYVDGDTAADMTISLTKPVGSAGSWNALAPAAAVTSSPSTLNTSPHTLPGTSPIGLFGSGIASCVIRIDGFVTMGLTAGALQLQAAQIAGPSGTPSTIYAGSFLLVEALS